MNKKWYLIYNPFKKIAGWEAFGIGIILLCITTVLGYYSNTVFYGISAQIVNSVTWSKIFLLQFTGLFITVAVMYATALLSAKHIRFQDILGTVTLSKYPLVLMVLLNIFLGDKMMETTNKLLEVTGTLSTTDAYRIFDDFSMSDFSIIMLFALVSLVLLVWEIALLFNAFKVSTNLKGTKCTLLFIAAVLVSEILINVAVSKIY